MFLLTLPLVPVLAQRTEEGGQKDVLPRSTGPADRAEQPQANPAAPVAAPASAGWPLTWEIERADAPKIFRDMGDRSLALDGEGHPHIAYGADFLYYGWYDGTAWHLETADASGDVGRFTSLALDSSGRPHISYYDWTRGDLKYASYDGTALRQAQGGAWRIETVDAAGDVGEYTSLALDAAGRPHISYQGNGHLNYATYDGTAWQLQTVDSAGWVGMYTSLALDAAGRPHISYYDATHYHLKYASYNGTAWLTVTVDAAGYTGAHTSLALDAAGRPHISYQGHTYGDLEYAFYDGTAWLTATVDAAGYVGWFTSLALDAAGRPHISYYDGGYFALKYAFYDGSAWLTATVDAAGGVAGDLGWYTSLALDGAGRPHISYFDYANRDLKYASYDGTAWLTTTVDAAGDVGEYTSLALDAAGRPHISYQGNYDLRYATYDGSTWHTGTVDTIGAWGGYTSLALDANGRPHISYYDETNDDLKYASYDGNAWLTATVDAAGDVGWYTSLALDAAGRPHISYQGNYDLRYATYDGSAWFTTTVDAAGEVGEYSSLALDVAGRPHISYYDSTNDDLKYASYDGSAWQLQTVDSAGWVGMYTSLALDAAGQPHISYYDETNGDLKYAHPCVPVAGAAAAGPARLPQGIAGLYSASYAPPSATLPVTFTWSSGLVSPTAAFTWTAVGPHTVTVTASNSCGQARAALTVTVFCQPLTGLAIAGPPALLAGQEGVYQAVPQPLTASVPLTFTWDNGAAGPTATYSWPLTGSYALAVTASSVCGGMQAAVRPVQVLAEWPYGAYLPLVLRSDSP